MLKKNAIKVGESSLIDLKVELHKSQLNFDKEKSSTSQPTVKPTPIEKSIKGKIIVEKPKQEKKVENENEDNKKFEEIKIKLEQKAKVYEKMMLEGAPESLENEDGYLVDFEKKKWENEDKINELLEDREQIYKQELLENYDPKTAVANEDDWIEFVDSLGRTRKCLKADYEEFKKRDLEIRPLDGEDLVDKRKQWREEIRAKVLKLEEEEKERMSKPVTFLHYTEASRGEIRQLGVGYYKFSSNEEERIKQRELLDGLRNKTVNQRKRVQDMKQKREDTLRKRLEKVKERKEKREKQSQSNLSALDESILLVNVSETTSENGPNLL